MTTTFGALNFTTKINKDVVRRNTAMVLLIREDFLSSVSLLDVRMFPHGSTAMKTKNGVSELHRSYVYNSTENRYSFLYVGVYCIFLKKFLFRIITFRKGFQPNFGLINE